MFAAALAEAARRDWWPRLPGAARFGRRVLGRRLFGRRVLRRPPEGKKGEEKTPGNGFMGVKPESLVGTDKGMIRSRSLLGGAKWISSSHSML